MRKLATLPDEVNMHVANRVRLSPMFGLATTTLPARSIDALPLDPAVVAGQNTWLGRLPLPLALAVPARQTWRGIYETGRRSGTEP